MTAVARPLPPANPVSAAYWEAARRHEFVLQRCDGCRRCVFYPRATCPHCGAVDLVWEPVSGQAAVYTFTTDRRARRVIAIVELEEGPRMTTNIVGCDPNDVYIGMPVEVGFDDRHRYHAARVPTGRA
ncbi:MAG: Zn-ribbon domain-containing OB-fold protein [Acidimicrobiales bacterium]